MNILFHSSCDDQFRIEYKVILAMHQGVQDTNEFTSDFNGGSSFNFCFLTKLCSTNLLIIGSPLVHNLWLMLFCFVFRIQVVYVMWDCYPVRILNKPFGNKLKILYQYLAEYIGSKIISASIIPNSDFLDFALSKKSIIIPFWPDDIRATANLHKISGKSSAVKFVFSGQINKTRGLDQCIEKLNELCSFDFTILIASPSDCSGLVKKYRCVDFVGHLPPVELEELYTKADVALVSLHPALQTPGFPSKTFDYVKAGLPIVYFGPEFESYEKIVSSRLGGLILTKQTMPFDIAELFELHSERDLTNFRNDVSFTENSQAALLGLLRSFM